jgi:apolipoprotein N-acyltransferase
MHNLATRVWLAVLSGLMLSLSFPLSLPPLPTALAAQLSFNLTTTPALGSIPIPLPNALMHQTPDMGFVQIPWLAYFALIPLLLAIRRVERPAAALWLGLLAGLVWNALSLLWFRDFGAPAVAAISAYFALPLSLFTYLAWWVAWGTGQAGTARAGGLRSVWGTAALWTAVEYLRGFSFWAFPWLLLGYTQARQPLFTQCADIGGVFLVGFLAALSNCAIAWLLGGSGRAALRWGHALSAAGLLCLSIAYGYWRLGSIAAIPPPAAGSNRTSISAMPLLSERAAALPGSLSVALVQGGQGSREEWTGDKQSEAAKIYSQPTQRILNGLKQRGGPKFSKPIGPSQIAIPGASKAAPTPRPEGTLVIWPESCLLGSNTDPRHLAGIAASVRNLPLPSSNSALLLGSVGRPVDDRRYENGCMLLESPSKASWAYSKIRLVPYGEVVPFRDVVRFLPYPWGDTDLSEGRSMKPLEWKGHKLGPMICYDNVFGFVPRAMVRQGAQFLVLMTNNSWYTLRSGARQHCDIDLLRAVELRRPLARVSTTGWSHTVDAAGRVMIETNAGGAGLIQDRLDPGPPQLLPRWASALLQGTGAGRTFLDEARWLREPLYVTLGDLFAQLCVVTALLLCLPPLLRGRGESFL